MTYSSSETSWLKYYALDKKSLSKVQTFRCFSALMKVHPIHYARFETTRSSFNQIFHHCSVSLKITPLCFLDKKARGSEIFKLLSGWEKILQIPCVMFETTSQFLFKLYFISWNCNEIDKSSPSKCKVSVYRLLT